jgi:hypothetical protein
MLRDGETDIAVILTEGIVKDIVAGNPVKGLCAIAINMGIHVAVNSNIKPFRFRRY